MNKLLLQKTISVCYRQGRGENGATRRAMTTKINIPIQGNNNAPPPSSLPPDHVELKFQCTHLHCNLLDANQRHVCTSVTRAAFEKTPIVVQCHCHKPHLHIHGLGFIDGTIPNKVFQELTKKGMKMDETNKVLRQPEKHSGNYWLGPTADGEMWEEIELNLVPWSDSSSSGCFLVKIIDHDIADSVESTTTFKYVGTYQEANNALMFDAGNIVCSWETDGHVIKTWTITSSSDTIGEPYLHVVQHDKPDTCMKHPAPPQALHFKAIRNDSQIVVELFVPDIAFSNSTSNMTMSLRKRVLR